MRIFLRILQFPFYIALFPLRFINAVYYNLLIHNVYKWSNYLLEVVRPSNPKEGGGSFWKWFVFLPLRFVKYLLYHGMLTLIESIIWTVIDTIFPAVTLYHGTDQTAADNMLCDPSRTSRTTNAQRGFPEKSADFWGPPNYQLPKKSLSGAIFFAYIKKKLYLCRLNWFLCLRVVTKYHYSWRFALSNTSNGTTLRESNPCA